MRATCLPCQYIRFPNKVRHVVGCYLTCYILLSYRPCPGHISHGSTWPTYGRHPEHTYYIPRCEASKYFFYLRYESGPLYKPSSRDFELALQEVSEADAARLRAIWNYWEEESEEESGEAEGDGLHPYHLVAQ